MSKYDQKAVGRRIKAYLDNHDLKYYEFAKKIGVSKMSVSYWIAGARRIRDPEVKERIAKQMGITVEELDYGHATGVNEELMKRAILEVNQASKVLGDRLDETQRASAIALVYELLMQGVTNPERILSRWMRDTNRSPKDQETPC